MKKKFLYFSAFMCFLSIVLLASCKKDKPFGREDYVYDGNLPGYSISFIDIVYNENTELVEKQIEKSLLLNADTELKWLPTPTKEGYTFEGWYLDDLLGTPFYHKTMPKGDLKAYARWSLNQEVIYVSPEGSPTASGKSTSSAMTLWDATRVVKAGAKIVLEEGTYKLNKTINLTQSATSNKMTIIEGNGAILNFSAMPEADANRGIKVTGDYHYIMDLTIRGAGDNGMLVSSNNNIIENCVFTECADTGLQISNYNSTLQPSIEYWPSYNLIKNCTSYNNADSAYEDADGFAAKLTVGYGNVFDGCIAAWNCDDGWDLYAKQDSGSIGTVTIRNCLSIQNGRALNDDRTGLNMANYGDGNGFKLGGTSMPGQVIVDNCIAAYNYAHGFTDNSNPGVITITNCTSINNGRFVGETQPSEISKVNTKSYSNINLNRDGLVNNKNYYENIFSFYSSAAYKRNTTLKTDEFNGSLNGGILYNATLNSEGKYEAKPYAVNTSLSVQNGEGFRTSRGVELTNLTDTACDYTDPLTILKTCGASKLHTALRNSDNSINIKDYYKSKTTLNNKTCGATLNKTSWDAYTHTNFTSVKANETAAEAKARSIIDAVELSVNPGYIYNDIYLPVSMEKYTITWKSSDESLVSIGTNVYGTTVKNIYGKVATKLTEDKTVTLTATVNVDGVTKNKDFTVTLQAFEARLGDVEGITEKIVISNETMPDVNDYKLYDYTTSTLRLVKGTDYKETITITWKADRYEPTSEVVSSISGSKPGFYTVTYDFATLDDFYKSQYKCNITVIASDDVYEIIDDDAQTNTSDIQKKKNTSVYLNSIIEGKVTVNGFAENNKGTIYAVTTKDALVPTQADILAAYNDSSLVTSDYISKIVKYDLNDYAFSISLDIIEGYEGNADLYMFIKNENGNGPMYSIKDIEPTIKISTYAEFYDAIRNPANKNKAYELIADIDCSVADTKSELFAGYGEWTETASTEFCGYFNGNFHTISKLVVNSTSSKGVGLFPVANGATIKNIQLTEVHVRGTSAKVGTLVGNTEEGVTITDIQLYNCSAQSAERVGGILGEVTGTKQSEVLLGIKEIGTTRISNISIYSNERSNIKYTIACTSGKYVGGILAHVQYGHNVYITNCFVNQTIQAVNQYGGGILGRLDLQTTSVEVVIDHCIFAGNISVSGQNYMGGIAGGLTTGTCTITNVVGVGNVTDSSKKRNPIVSVNFCDSKTIDTQKYYSLKDTFKHENWYYVLEDFDSEVYTEYKTADEYLEAMLLNNEYYGQYVYRSELEKVETWTKLGFDMENIFEYSLNSTYGYNFKLRSFK